MSFIYSEANRIEWPAQDYKLLFILVAIAAG